MKKKKKTVEQILARADKLFERSNFALALREYQKVAQKLSPKQAGPRDRIAAKIEVCRRKADAAKALELIKRARKATKRGDLNAALNHYQTAQTLNGGNQELQAQITELEQRLAGSTASVAAQRAEDAGSFQEAADLYARARRKGGDDQLQLKRARCLVKAANWTAALDVFATLDPADATSRYDYGLALANCGRWRACLEQWSVLARGETQFRHQWQAVCRCLAADLYRRPARQDTVAAIYADLNYLLSQEDLGLPASWLRSLEQLRDLSRYGWIETLWAAEQYERIPDLLAAGPPPEHPQLLALHAKVWFKLAQRDGRYLTSMVSHWLSAVFTKDLHPATNCSGTHLEAVRRKLIAMAAEVVQTYSDTPAGAAARTLFEWEQKYVRRLHELAAQQQQWDGPVCTPLLADKLGKSLQILNLIQQNRTRFASEAQFLETGAAYSAAGKCLYLAETGEVQAAAELLDNMDLGHTPGGPGNGDNGDGNSSPGNDGCAADGIADILDYARTRIHFAQAVACIQSGDARMSRYIKAAPDLFARFPLLEQQFTREAMDVDDWENLRLYEEALTYIHARRPTPAVCQALSLVMTRFGIQQYNDDRLGDKTLKVRLQKALEVDPDNGFARDTLRQTLIDLEIEAVYKAIEHNKQGTASRIARESQFPEVHEKYFEIIEDLFNALNQAVADEDERLLHMQKIYNSAAQVDTRQAVVVELRQCLDTAEAMVSL